MSDRRVLVKRMKKVQSGKFTINLEKATRQIDRMTTNLLESRQNFLKSLMDPSNRDLDTELGYPEDPVPKEKYMEFFRRHGIAKKCVTAYPDGTWAIWPDVYESDNDSIETAFEKAWTELANRLRVMHYFHRADVISGIGRFGVIFLGFSGNQQLDQPVRGLNDDGEKVKYKFRKPLKLNYLRVLDETLVRVAEYVDDETSPRNGQPLYYEVTFFDPNQQVDGVESHQNDGNEFQPTKVHWTRILHLADNRISNEIFGQPRMEPVINWLWDLRKVLGGSAEMFWKGAFPGFSVEAIPLAVEAGLEPDEESVKEQFDQYMRGLKRYLALVGMTVKPLAPQVADPSKHVEELLRNIAASLDVPMRVFTGSEAAHLASTQDITSWKERLKRRQVTYVNPMIIYPFIERLQLVGVLPATPKGFKIDWQDLNAASEGDKADIALKKTQALSQYATGGVEMIIPPKPYFTNILGFSSDQADEILKLVKKSATKFTKEVWQKPTPAAGTGMTKGGKIKNPTKKTGRSRNGLGAASKT